jgi:hypothetical protein
MASKRIKAAENIYAPFVIVGQGKGHLREESTVHHNGWID